MSSMDHHDSLEWFLVVTELNLRQRLTTKRLVSH